MTFEEEMMVVTCIYRREGKLARSLAILQKPLHSFELSSAGLEQEADPTYSPPPNSQPEIRILVKRSHLSSLDMRLQSCHLHRNGRIRRLPSGN